MMTSFRRARLSWITLLTVGGGTFLVMLVMSLGWLGTQVQAQCWTLLLAAIPGSGHTARIGSGAATEGVGHRINGLAAKLEGLGARDAARNLRAAEQLYHHVNRHSRTVLGLPPAGPDAVSHFLTNNAAALKLSAGTPTPASGSGSTSGSESATTTLASNSNAWGSRENALFDAMSQRATLVHASAPAGEGMKLLPGVISEL